MNTRICILLILPIVFSVASFANTFTYNASTTGITDGYSNGYTDGSTIYDSSMLTGSESDTEYRSWVGFSTASMLSDLDAAGQSTANISSATLRVYLSSITGTPADVELWEALTSTSNFRAGVFTNPLFNDSGITFATTSSPTGTYIEADVTSIVIAHLEGTGGSSSYRFQVASGGSSGTNNYLFESALGTNQPELVVVTAVPESSSYTLIIAGLSLCILAALRFKRSRCFCSGD